MIDERDREHALADADFVVTNLVKILHDAVITVVIVMQLHYMNKKSYCYVLYIFIVRNINNTQ